MAMLNLFQEMESMQREMNELFRGVGIGRGLEPSFATVAGGRRYPRINLREEADALYVDALLPGIDAKALEITVMGNTLTLAGERHEPARKTPPGTAASEEPAASCGPSTCPPTSTSRRSGPTTMTAC